MHSRRLLLPAVLLYTLVTLLCPPGSLRAQNRGDIVKISVVPDHKNWQYKLGEQALFHVSVLQHGHPIDNARVRYELGPELMPPTETGMLTLENGCTTLDGGTMTTPGFLRCKVIVETDARSFTGIGTAGFAPLAIGATTILPDDFRQFWDDALAKVHDIPLQPTRELLPEQSTENVLVYHVSFQNTSPSSRVYGILAMPSHPGSYPALLQVPGAGVRGYRGNVDIAEQGVIVLTIGIHGIPVTMGQDIYQALRGAALNGYWNYGLENRDIYYYKRVYLGTSRSVDYIHTLPEFDGERLAVYGGSQGGALSIVTAALDVRVKRLAAYYPALSDMTGYLHDRAGGWPHMFRQPAHQTMDKIRTSYYYDITNFARHVRIPGIYSWGFNDTTCPPSSMYAAYNNITAPKSLYLVPETGHWTYPEQREHVTEWIMEYLVGAQ